MLDRLDAMLALARASGATPICITLSPEQRHELSLELMAGVAREDDSFGTVVTQYQGIPVRADYNSPVKSLKDTIRIDVEAG